MSHDSMPFHQCDECSGIVGLWEEVVGTHPITGKALFLHDACARPEHNAVPIREWLDARIATKETT